MYQTPLLIGEFGVAEVAGGSEFLSAVMRLADQMTAGWAVWAYDRGGYGWLDAQRNETAKIDVLVRTYPQRVAGEPIYYDFDPATRSFRLAFEERGVAGPTVIYVPERRFYPDGWDLWLSDPEGTWSSAWDTERELLSLWTDPAQPSHAVLLTPRAGDAAEPVGRGSTGRR